MSFFENIKTYLSTIIDNSKDFFKKILKKQEKTLSYEKSVAIHHSNDFSYVFISSEFISIFNEKDFSQMLDYLVLNIKNYLNNNSTICINIICTLMFKDNLGIIYTHSLTYKKLFTILNFTEWKKQMILDINELLTRYNDSNLLKIEFRFDYIKDKII